MKRMTAGARAAGLAVTVAAGLLAVAGPARGATAAPAAEAPGGPGAMSFFDLGRKDCVGTARNTTSKVWYTVAGGVLSDVYEPTVDNTNVGTLQYIVTDGSSFTDLQTRDMTYTVAADPTGMACTVTATSADHGYQLVTTYVTDPASDTVLMQTRLSAAPGSHTNISGLHLYARLDAHANGNGGGGGQNAGGNTGVLDTSTGSPVPVVGSTNTVTQAANRDYAVPTFMALRAAAPSPSASVGFAGTPSDGLAMLDSARALTSYNSAQDGHVTATEQVIPDSSGRVTLALGFGRSQAGAMSAAGTALSRPFGAVQDSYTSGWDAYDGSLRRPPARFPGLTTAQAKDLDLRYYLSANVIKASEDKTFPGAIVASLASPWGQAVRPAPRSTASRCTSAPTARCSPATCTRRSPAC